MGDYQSERYRRNTPWRAEDNRRDDDLGDPWDDNRGSRWTRDDWQPESSGDSWDEARRRQRLTPGQLSEGGPVPSGYRSGSEQGSNLRYGLNGGYGWEPEQEENWRLQEQYKSRQYASEYGDYGDVGDTGGQRGRQRGQQQRDFGGESGYGGYGGNYGSGYGGGSGERYGSQQRGQFSDSGYGQQRGFGNADQEWLREAERRAPAYRGQRGQGGQTAYFNDLRSDTRYWTEPRDEWGDNRPQHAQRYGRDYMSSRGYDEELGYGQRRSSGNDWRDRDDDDREYREEEHGPLYNLGHRIGQVMSEWFGSDSEEKRTGPRGYTRTDERIRDEICERLTFTTGLDVREVSVDVDKGKVTLSGTVQTRGQKYDIEDLADNTFGVTEVENNIRVQRPQDVDKAVSGAGGFNGW